MSAQPRYRSGSPRQRPGWARCLPRALALLAAALTLAAGPLFLGGGCGDDGRRGVPCCPVCGDGVCELDENGCNCSADCPPLACAAIFPTCGDGVCETSASPGESHERCPEDCPLDCRRCETAPR